MLNKMMDLDWRDKASSWNQKCVHFFSQNVGEDGDVTFLVGESKEKIKAYKLFLRIASPVFERTFSADLIDWDHVSVIELPDILPGIFREFLQIILSDKPVKLLKDLDLPLSDVFHLLYIAKKYRVTQMSRAIFDILLFQITPKNALLIYENVVAFDDDSVILNFISTRLTQILTEEDGLYSLSREPLTTILQSDILHVDELVLFEAVCKWASAQCRKEGIEVTGENLRSSLDHLLYLIRFTQMSVRDLVSVVIPKNILTNEEALQAISYISKTDEEKGIMLSENPNFPFNITGRMNSEVNLHLDKGKTFTVQKFPLDINAPPFVCNGTPVDLEIQHPNQRLTIYSIGFFGPIQGNSKYDVRISVELCSANGTRSHRSYIHHVHKKVLAYQGTFFRVEFKTPVVLVSTIPSVSHSIISFAIKGADVPSTGLLGVLTHDNLVFNYNNGNPAPLVQLQYEIHNTAYDRLLNQLPTVNHLQKVDHS